MRIKLTPSESDLRFFQSSPFNGDDPWLKMTLLRLLSKQEMGVSKNRGTPKWMIYHGKLIKIDDLGVPLFLGNTQMMVTF